MIMVSIVLEVREVIALGRQLKGQVCHLFGDRENVGMFPRGRENTKIVGKLEMLVENRGELRGRGL